MLAPSIRANIAPQMSAKVTRLFNGSLSDIVAELLQNARRAQASKVTIVGSTGNWNGEEIPLLTISDDGCGIADPDALLSLGASGWSSDLAAREDAAGMGLFSLAGHHVKISTRHVETDLGWSTDIGAAAWTDGSDIPVKCCVRGLGTTISVAISPDWLEQLPRVVAEAAKFYPLPVTFNNEHQKQTGFLDGARLVERFGGLDVGVFLDDNPGSHWSPTLNFHGLTVNHKLPVVGEVGRPVKWHCKVDIRDCPKLQLTLPARKEVVEGPFLAELAAACERAIYRAIAAQGQHRLSFESYSHGLELGITLPEATPGLTPFIANCNESILNDSWKLQPVFGAGGVQIEPFDACYEQSLARALELAPPEVRPVLLRSEPAFNGYSWYDAMGAVIDMRFVVETSDDSFTDDLCGELMDPLVRHVDAVHVVLAIVQHDRELRLSLPTDLLLQPDDNYDLDNCSFAVVSREPDDGQWLSPEVLARYLDRAYFCASYDRECDSFDTQLRAWQEASYTQAVRTVQGPETATRVAIEQAFNQHVVWLIPRGTTVTLTYVDNCATAVIAPTAAVEA